jgi:hypothetical protein
MRGLSRQRCSAKLANNQCCGAAAAHTLLQGGDPAIGTAAASSNDRFGGFNDRTFTGTETYRQSRRIRALGGWH